MRKLLHAKKILIFLLSLTMAFSLYIGLAVGVNSTKAVIEKEVLISSANGSQFTYPADANGWGTYVQTAGVSWSNLNGETVINQAYGIEGEWNHYGDSGMTLLNYAYNANYTPLDVTKPIRLQYKLHPYRTGDYTFALFDNLSTALKAGNGTWGGTSVGAKIWMSGANENCLDIVNATYQLNNRLLFNNSLYYNQDVFPNPYTTETYNSKYVDVIFAIGTTGTTITVDGNYVGVINVKQSDFTNGYAYMTVANARTSNGTHVSIIAKKISQAGISSMSVSLSDGLTVNANATLFAGYSNPEMTFEFNGESTVVSNYTKAGNSDKYTFAYSGVTPKYMNKEITMTLTAEVNGNRQTIDVKTTTVRDYVMKILNSTSTLTIDKAMAIDLLNYGALVQKYTNQDVSDLANKLLTNKQKEIGATLNANTITSVKEGVNSENVAWETAKLILDNKVGVRFEFNLQNGATKDNVKIAVSIKGQTTIYDVKEDGDIYYINCMGISPSEFNTPIVATAYLNGQPTQATMTYSVNSWIKEKHNDVVDGELANALYVYGKSANVIVESSQVGEKEVETPRDMNMTSPRTEIITENHEFKFSEDLWKAPGYIRAPEFDKGNSYGFFLDNPILANNKFFVYVGLPVGASATNKVPGIVLVHGATGTAFYEWVDFWTARGYAAIALCTDQKIPSMSGSNMTTMATSQGNIVNTYTCGGVTFNIGPNNGGSLAENTGGYMDDYYLPVEQQWGYNAIAKVIISNSFLRSFSEVDPNRIGITGISYGSFLTCQAAGYDDRFAFAMPIYGSYCQDLGDAFFAVRAFGKDFDTTFEKNTLYNNYKLMDNNETPFLFVNSNVDPFFTVLSSSMSNKLMKNSKMLLKDGFQHGHELGAFTVPELLTFADSICFGSTRLIEIVSQPSYNTGVIKVSLPTGVSLASATLFYTDSTVFKETTQWYQWTCTVEGDKVYIPVMAEGYSYYVNITDSNGNTISSQVVVNSNS
ncbi:MAG: hypothetical protein E7362_01440 [Clostridiales bacterium]|nr:hypothetical protein [Clostridiales bacterium]